MMPLFLHHAGSGLLGSIARGFSWAVGYMLATGLGINIAAVLLGLAGALLVFRYVWRHTGATGRQKS